MTTDLPADLPDLRAVAEAATPGPWAWEPVGTQDNGWCLGVVWDDNDQPMTGRIEPGAGNVVDSVCENVGANHFHDAAHIATFDPPTVLALLDTITDLRAEVDRWQEVAADCVRAVDMERARAEAAEAALARVSALADEWEAKYEKTRPKSGEWHSDSSAITYWQNAKDLRAALAAPAPLDAREGEEA